MIDYRLLADRRRRLGVRKFRSYVDRRPGDSSGQLPAGPGAGGDPRDPWRMVAAFSSESFVRFLANKLRYSFLYKAVGLVVVVMCLSVSSFLAVTANQLRQSILVVQNIVQKEEEPSRTFLVLGADDMKGERGRSDAVMVVRVDMKQRKIRALSIPRDSYVNIPYKGGRMDKLNHAYAFGGPELSKETVEKYLRLRVDHYGVINYAIFERVVDIAGGVPIDVEKQMDYDDNAGNLHIHLRPGEQVLDGVQAKGYVRFRHDALGDFGRVKRQQKFAKALLERLKSPKVIAMMAFNVNTLFEYVQTDVPTDLAIGLLYHFKDFDPKNVEMTAIPSESKKMWAEYAKKELYFMVSEAPDVAACRDWLLTGKPIGKPAAIAAPAPVAATPVQSPKVEPPPAPAPVKAAAPVRAAPAPPEPRIPNLAAASRQAAPQPRASAPLPKAPRVQPAPRPQRIGRSTRRTAQRT